MCGCDSYMNVTGVGLDPVSMGVNIAIQTGVGYLFSSGQNKKNKELAEKLSQLDVAQQEELKTKVASVSTELKKTEVLFDYLNKIKESQIKKQIAKKRIVNFAIIGVGVLALVVVVLKLKEKNG